MTLHVSIELLQGMGKSDVFVKYKRLCEVTFRSLAPFLVLIFKF